MSETLAPPTAVAVLLVALDPRHLVAGSRPPWCCSATARTPSARRPRADRPDQR